MSHRPDSLRTVPEEAGQPVISAAQGSATVPSYIGRYRVERLLGEGGFGRVYLGYDDQLRRPVAIKVPKLERAVQPGYAETYLAEARILASLDHPNIVPVHDVGQTSDGLPFVVSKWIEGSDLKQMIRDVRPSYVESAGLVAAVAEALHFAHTRGLVHRDIKPGNILIDRGGKPFVADFGLALREEDFGKGAEVVGTPAYMSPEQARGEGHRVDGRSDIFSLGVVFYELLTGRRPFRGETQSELLDHIVSVEPRPPRQIDDAIPRELERICLKALARRAAERFTTALDMAEDLRHFLAAAAPAAQPKVLVGVAGAAAMTPTPTLPVTPSPESRTVKVVPKGLRSFDAGDADFFLELLPGPRDRDGLPESIRFWKGRVEETDADNTFAVGLLYGPSGCGKSSLVKAGLLPRLGEHVRAVYVEATAEETEARLLKGLRKHCPDLPGDLGLIEALTALRRERCLPPGRKVLLVLDQFEQWLHARRGEQSTALVQALRQCDGGRVQGIVMVRDDFWMAATRFMQALEVRLVEGQNTAVVDLFDPRHARKVLAAFGRAFGALPDSPGDLSRDQASFLDQAVAGLAQDEKVVCVRLALFAEMVKGKPWTPATLKEVGGAEGVGVTFLEETFSARTASPPHRLHQKAAQAVLKALLPESGSDIKGGMRSRDDLLHTSGYDSRPADFDDLLRILDGELWLITPTDPEGTDDESRVRPGETTGQPARFYQLTHDYLVASLRQWLTRKQKETRRGRAELRLAERAALWTSKPEKRHLPAWWEWLNIRLFTRKQDWTASQRTMMRKASRYHAARGLLLAAGLLLLSGAGWEGFGRLRAVTLRDRLLEATTADVPGVVEDMAPYRRWLDPLLREAYADAEQSQDARKQLHASLALVPSDPGQVEYLHRRLLSAAGPDEVIAIRAMLLPHKDSVVGPLWEVLEDRAADPGRRLRAACALADYAAEDGRWKKVSGDVAAKLVTENALVISRWAEALRPVGNLLLSPLADLVDEEGRSGVERWIIAQLYVGFAGDQPDAFARLERTLSEAIAPEAPQDARLALARRQANAAAALAAVGRWEKVWPLLHLGPDPTLRSYLIDRLAAGGAEASVLFDRLGQEPEASVRQAALLALGEFGPDRLPVAQRAAWIAPLLALYRDDPDPGVHGAAAWLLRQWGQQEKLAEVDRPLATGKVEGSRRWYVNGQEQTMVIVPGPGEVWVGEGRERRQRRIDHSFALAAREVTVEEFRRFRKDHQHPTQYAPTADCPAPLVSWYDAAAYCNWLSEQEGIPREQWCYLPVVMDGKEVYAEGMKVKANHVRLSGYRLPTEVEWEYGCRSGSVTPWSHGEAEDLLGKYAWFLVNSMTRSRPVGLLRPNGQGLFDMLGNIWEWCQDEYALGEPGGKEGTMKAMKKIDEIVINDRPNNRVLRGGCFGNDALSVRSSFRFSFHPASPDDGAGFRPAKTVR